MNTVEIQDGSMRQKIISLALLGRSDQTIARVTGLSVDTVRQLRAEVHEQASHKPWTVRGAVQPSDPPHSPASAGSAAPTPTQRVSECRRSG